MDWFWGKSTLKNQERLFNRYLESQLAVFYQMICRKSWMLQSKSGGIYFLDVSLKNNSTICSSSSAPYYIARCHLGTDIWIDLCLTQFDKTMWITHPYHPSKSSKKCQKYVQKKTWECISMYFPFRFFSTK